MHFKFELIKTRNNARLIFSFLPASCRLMTQAGSNATQLQGLNLAASALSAQKDARGVYSPKSSPGPDWFILYLEMITTCVLLYDCIAMYTATLMTHVYYPVS
jgi:hypothetical protein